MIQLSISDVIGLALTAEDLRSKSGSVPLDLQESRSRGLAVWLDLLSRDGTCNLGVTSMTVPIEIATARRRESS